MEWTLITGGAKRLGAEICITLARQGYHVLIHYNTSEEEALEVIKQCQGYGVAAECIQGNFSSPQETNTFIKKLQKSYRIHNLINNVGNFFIKSALQTTQEEWLDIFQTNLHAPFVLTKALVPHIKETQGSIINIGVAGIHNVKSEIMYPAYSCTKTALWFLTRSLAEELASFLVRVNMVSPGYLPGAIDIPPYAELPMLKPVTYKEVARVILFLLDPASANITGQNIEVAGAIKL